MFYDQGEKVFAFFFKIGLNLINPKSIKANDSYFLATSYTLYDRCPEEANKMVARFYSW